MKNIVTRMPSSHFPRTQSETEILCRKQNRKHSLMTLLLCKGIQVISNEILCTQPQSTHGTDYVFFRFVCLGMSSMHRWVIWASFCLKDKLGTIEILGTKYNAKYNSECI